MSDDYLYDGEGRDPEVEGLEALLRPLAHRPGAAPVLQRNTSVVHRHTRSARRDVLVASALASAAGLLFVAALGLLGPGAVAPQGAAVAGAAPVTGGVADPSTWVAAAGREYGCVMPDGVRSLRPGNEVHAADAPLVIELAGIGTLTAEANARLTVLAIRDDLHKLRLERGTVHAAIRADARPRLFQVETPASLCVDLGCLYTLSVDEAGRAHVRVTAGKVSFEDAGREVYVPAGAGCRATPGRGAGPPVWEDAPETLDHAARAFEEAPAQGRAAAALALAQAAERAQDSLTLFHLLDDPDVWVRRAGIRGIARVDSLPDGVTEAALLAGDRAARAALRSHLERWW